MLAKIKALFKRPVQDKQLTNGPLDVDLMCSRYFQLGVKAKSISFFYTKEMKAQSLTVQALSLLSGVDTTRIQRLIDCDFEIYNNPVPLELDAIMDSLYMNAVKIMETK